MWFFGIFLTEFSPNPVAPQTEWVEMFNDSSETADISGYIIRDSTLSNKQILSGTIPPQNYFAFSFDHNFLNNTTADVVRLFDKNNNLIDSQSSKILLEGLSFSRQTDGSWCPTDISPNFPNNLCKDSYSLQNSPTPISYISLEIVDATSDPDDGDESIIIKNPNNFSVSLLDWRVRDNSGTVRKLTCQSVEAQSTCTATFSSGYLNNDTDKITLLDPLKREISIYSYDFSKKSPTTKPTSTKTATKIPTVKSPLLASPKFPSLALSRGGTRFPNRGEGLDSVVINKSTPIHNYLSIILMLIGSIFILSPFIFHGKNNKK